jgi:cyanate permease
VVVSGLDGKRSRVRRRLDVVGAIAAVIGIVGFVLKPSYAPLWAFLILFGVTTVPERALRALRERRARSRSSPQRK